MANYALTSDSSVAQSLAANDTLFISNKATLTVPSASAITATSGATITIAGVVYSAAFQAISATTSLILTVSGQLFGASTYGVIVGDNASVTVEKGGIISATYTPLVFNGASTSAYVFVQNAGTISAAPLGFGAITATANGLYIRNTGDILGSISGGGVLDLVNDGTILGDVYGGYTSGSVRVINTGVISGRVVTGAGSDYVDMTAGVSRDYADLGAGNDIYFGSAGPDVVYGGDGLDTLKGYGGDDLLSGGLAVDTLFGGDGDDILYGGYGGDVMSGGAGADTFLYNAVADATTPDLITDFESGVDKIDISGLGPGGAVAINLGIGASTVYFQTASGVGGQGVISLYGTIAANDIKAGSGTAFFITGSVLGETIVGTSGADYITGGGGADILTGGAGADVFVYGSVADSPAGANDVILDFATGSDKLDFTGLAAGSAIAINMGPWSTVYYQTATSGSQGVIGVSGIVRGADLNVSAGATVYITGTAGADVIFGSTVVDYINGGAGDDNIAGGGGADVLTGGAGSDAFYFFSVGDSPFAAPDRIPDFDPSQDFIDLSGLDANAGAAGQQHFTLVAGFTGVAGQLVSYVSGGFINFAGDVNGDAVADFLLLVTPTAYWDPYADPSHLRL